MRVYEERKITRFIAKVRDDSRNEEIELPPNGNPYEIFRYRREERCQDMPTGFYEYGFIYRNNKGRFTLVGLAKEDWNKQ